MNRNIEKNGHLALLGVALAATLMGCVGQNPTGLYQNTKNTNGSDDPTQDPGSQPGYASSPGNTFDHDSTLGEDDAARDPLEIAKQREEEGPPEVRTRLHSCQKLPIATIANVLTDLGVDVNAKAAQGQPPSAGDLLKGGGTALGAANYPARVGEAIVWTAAGAAKQFDIFVQAAPVIIQNLPNAPLCQVNGTGPQMFDANGQCNADAISCLIGRPATPEHVAICNSLVVSASTPEKGQAIAVATMLSAAHSCE
jgi:hypothetical protein